MRLDKPTLQCDRCGFTTTDLHIMGTFSQLETTHMTTRETWDLCSPCYRQFINEFIMNENTLAGAINREPTHES